MVDIRGSKKMVGSAHPTKHCNPGASRSSLLQTRRAEVNSDLHLPLSCLHFWNRGRWSRGGSQGKTSNYNGCLMAVECTINVGFHWEYRRIGRRKIGNLVDIRGIKKIDGGQCPPYETLQSGSEQGFAPTNATCGSEFRLEFTLKLPSLLELGAVESQAHRGKALPILVTI